MLDVRSKMEEVLLLAPSILKFLKKRRVGCNKWVKKDTMIVRVSENR